MLGSRLVTLASSALTFGALAILGFAAPAQAVDCVGYYLDEFPSPDLARIIHEG
jgi:hypothetical protein